MRASDSSRHRLIVAALAFLTAGLLAPANGTARADDEAKPTIGALKKTIDDPSEGERTREGAARAIAEGQFDPEGLAPWLAAHLATEKALHVRIALAYALAAQGEVEGLRVLVGSLEQTGHLGYVFLTRISGEDFGDSDKGWNRPAWDRWLSELDAKTWKDLQRQKHLKREPLDGDEAGLAAAIAWWDSLAFPDVTTLPFGRVGLNSGLNWGGLADHDQWHFAFLVREDETTFTEFDTELAERTHSKRRVEHEAHARFDRGDIVRDVAAALDEEKSAKDKGALDRTDVFGGEWGARATRSRAFVLARALEAHGAKELALSLWKRVAAQEPYVPKYGPWKTLDLLKEDATSDARRAWEAAVAEPGRTWADILSAFRRWRARFDTDGKGAADEATLVRMVSDEAAAATTSPPRDAAPADRAKALVRALPSVTRPAEYTDSTIHSRADSTESKDALDDLIELGYDAVPALRDALSDTRFSKCRAAWVGFASNWRPPEPRPVAVRELALYALKLIAHRGFVSKPESWTVDWPAITAAVDAWWKTYSAEGEVGVLRRGVLAREQDSALQARVLVAKHPEDAFAIIEQACDGAKRDLRIQFIETLEPLARPEAQRFLLAQARGDDVGVRAAAAKALHRQGHHEEVERLVDEWPAILSAVDDDSFPWNRDAPGALLDLFFDLEPQRALRRVRATLAEISGDVRRTIVEQIREPLVREPDAEAVMASLVLDEHVHEEREFTPAAVEAQNLGERAAERAAELWPERYSFSRSGSARDRLLARHRVVAAWRAAKQLPPLPSPEFVHIEPVSPAKADPLIAAWLAARDDDRAGAESAIIAAGLGTLPALERSLATLDAADARRPALDRVVRRVALIAREIVWSSTGPRPNAALSAYVESARGAPVAGAWITGLLRQVAVDTPEGATGIDLLVSKPGDDTGAVLWLELTTHTVPWQNTRGGWILDGDGPELVDAPDLKHAGSWWHECRGPQLDAALLIEPEQEVRVRRTIARVR